MKSLLKPRIIYLFFVALYVAGNFYQVVAQPTVNKVATFLYFQIEKTEQLPSVKLVESRVITGEFKQMGVVTHETYDEGLLVIRVTDRSSKLLFETTCNNPIDQHLEYVNEKGELNHARVQHTQGTFEARVPFDLKDHSISIYMVDENNRLKLLFTR